MATAEQIKSLIRSHLSDDDERFFTLALQVAAHEAQQGHEELAHDIKKIVDDSRRARVPNALLKFPLELAGMVLSEKSDIQPTHAHQTRNLDRRRETLAARARSTGDRAATGGDDRR